MTVTVPFVLWSRSIGLLLGQGKGLDSLGNKLLVFSFLFKLPLSWKLLSVEDDCFGLSGLCCQIIFVSKYQERIKCLFICMLFSSILLNWVCLPNNLLIYNWDDTTFSSKNCLLQKVHLFCLFGNYSNNINKPLLQHHSSQMCFYWRILNFYNGKDMENIFFIWKTQMERGYIINYPLCHYTNFHFSIGSF